MNRRVLIAVAVGMIASACASGPPPAPPAPPAPAPLDPTGTYDITVSAQGMELGGVLIIGGSADAGYTGSVDTEMGGAPLADIVVDGQTMRFGIPEAGMTAEVTFEGDEFTGWMAGAMGDADIIGVKRTGG